MNISGLLQNQKIVILGGSGGVGKTTLSAALALRMARLGRRTMVLTIDPARRLANALGIKLHGGEEINLPPTVWAGTSSSSTGSFRAMMLDMKSTFDTLVEKSAPSSIIRDRILSNTYYQYLSTAVSGSQDYMAIEKLYQLSRREDLDLIILDTPPTRSAWEFLNSPNQIVSILEGGILKMLIRPYLKIGRKAFRIFRDRGEILAAAAERLVGAEILREIAELALDFEEILELFKTRADKVQSLLRDSRTTFLIVTRPRSDLLLEARQYRERLAEAGIPFGGFLVNRMEMIPEAIPSDSGQISRDLAQILLPGLDHLGFQQRLLQNFSEVRARQQGEKESVSRLLKTGNQIFPLPELEEPIQNLEGLSRLALNLS